jgi:hypothetical protein
MFIAACSVVLMVLAAIAACSVVFLVAGLGLCIQYLLE